jgi:hypothetical protein
MGVKATRRIIAVITVLVMIITSAVCVFAETSSPHGGSKLITTIHYSAKTMDVEGTGGIKYKHLGESKWHTVDSTGHVLLTGLKQKKYYTVISNEGTAYRWFYQTHIKKVKGGKKSATVKWKKIKGAKKYVVKAVKGNKTVIVNTTKTSKKIKGLTKGKWKIYVRVLKKKSGHTYVSGWSLPKTVKVK